ncbi:MAG: hypothetical protein AAGI01_12080, partial [Myxococcota bacterium]
MTYQRTGERVRSRSSPLGYTGAERRRGVLRPVNHHDGVLRDFTLAREGREQKPDEGGRTASGEHGTQACSSPLRRYTSCIEGLCSVLPARASCSLRSHSPSLA